MILRRIPDSHPLDTVATLKPSESKSKVTLDTVRFLMGGKTLTPFQLRNIALGIKIKHTTTRATTTFHNHYSLQIKGKIS